MLRREILIPVRGAELIADLTMPDRPRGLIVFAHGSGSSRHSPRNRFVAGELAIGGLGTLLVDLLTPREERLDAMTGELRFDIDLLAGRLADVVAWCADNVGSDVKLGLFGASTGAAAALITAAAHPELIGAVVSRGGRPDLAGAALGRVRAPTLLIVGGDDGPVVALNQRALAALECGKRLTLVPRATHLFSEPGALESVAELARDWFLGHLTDATIPLRELR